MDNHSARRVTRADVARVAGTSVAVVSYDQQRPAPGGGSHPVARAGGDRADRLPAERHRAGAGLRQHANLRAGGAGYFQPVLRHPRGRCSRKPSAAAACCCWATPATIVSASMSLSTTCCAAVDGLLYTSVDRHPWFDLIRASGTPCVMIDTIDSRPASVPFASTSATPPAVQPAICCNTAIATSAFLSAR